MEVDMTIPEELHDYFNSFPFLMVKETMLSDSQQKWLKDNQKKYTEFPKLVPNLCDKKNYVIHYRLLKLYVKLGIHVTKIHRAVQFEQREWMKQCIDFNTDKRKHSKNEFEKDFYKLCNNAPFGKTMENVRKRKKLIW